MLRLIYALAPAAMLVAGLPVPARADDGPDLSANVGAVSDYRFRGISLSDRNPAMQAGVDLEAGPVFAGVWSSTIAEYGGAEVEFDVYGGLKGSLGGVDWRAGAYAYLYPGGDEVNYVELVGQVERAFGPLTAGLEVALAPPQVNVDDANLYLGATTDYDLGSGWTVTLRGGYEDGFYERKLDGEVRLGYSTGPLEASVAYVDTNYSAPEEAGRLAAGGLVASLTLGF